MDFLVTLPADAEVELTLPSLSRVTGVTPQATIQIDTKGSATKQVTVAPDTITADDPNTVVTLADGNLVGTANGANNSVTTAGAEVTVTVDSADGTPVTATANEVTNAVEVRTPGREGVTDETNYEVVTQTSSNAIDRRIVNLDGSESTSQEDGRLANTQVYQEPPAELAVPAVKPGLPSAESRAIGGVVPTSTSSTTTVAGTTTTTSTTTTTIAGSTTSGVARPTTTAPRASTTVAQTQTTTAQNANVRKNVVVTTNLDGWGPGLDDPISSGFSAKLTGGLGQLDGDPCADVACLESVQATILGGGTDSATGQDTVVPATFTMSGVSGPFAVRCGAGGNWVNASATGATYSASCSFANLTDDETIYLRA